MSAAPEHSEATYWSKHGRHQNKYDLIWHDHVPAESECKLLAAEQFRCIARLYYDYYNNGSCNWDRMVYDRAMMQVTLACMVRQNLPSIEWTLEPR